MTTVNNPTEPDGIERAARSQTGRWHRLVDGHAACSTRLRLTEETALPVGRTPTRPRCQRAACKAIWERGVSESTRRRELMQREHALAGLDRSRWARPYPEQEKWKAAGWLDPHIVFIVRYPSERVYRVAFVMAHRAASLPAQLRRERAVPVASTSVPNRHAAVLTKLDVLAGMEPWRRELPPGRIPVGGTEVWRTSAPSVDLDAIAAMYR